MYSQSVGSRPGEMTSFYPIYYCSEIIAMNYDNCCVTSTDIRWTREGPSWDDDSYLGYSVAHGEFSGDNESDVAVGM